MKPPAYLGVYDGAAEVAVGHRRTGLHPGRVTAASFQLVTVAESPDPSTSVGGIRRVADALLGGLEPAGSDLLILPGAEAWDADGGEAFAAAAGCLLDAGVPVAATCGATAGLARAGLLDAVHLWRLGLLRRRAGSPAAARLGDGAQPVADSPGPTARDRHPRGGRPNGKEVDAGDGAVRQASCQQVQLLLMVEPAVPAARPENGQHGLPMPGVDRASGRWVRRRSAERRCWG